MCDDLEIVLIEGDIMGDDFGFYFCFKCIMSVVGKLVYFVFGNYDLNFDVFMDENSLDMFKWEWGLSYYLFDIGDVYFVILDNMCYFCILDIDNVDGKYDFCNDLQIVLIYNGIIDVV